MEPCAQKTTKKHNPELVDTVFRLMFEILWVAPYDRRRSNAALSEFERRGRETAVLLAATDLRSASAGSNRRRFSPAGSVPKRLRRCGGSPPSCRSMPPLPWAEPFAGACLLRGFVGLFAVCYRFAAGRHALNRFCVAPDLCLICLVPTCLVPTCLVLNLLCVAPAFAEPPLCRSRFPRRGPCRMSQKK